MIMKRLPFVLTILLVLLMVMSGCTKRHNLTSDNWSNLRPLSTVDTSFVMGYSYTHDVDVTGLETQLICGSENGIEAMSILNFTGLPDSLVVIGQPTLKIIATRRSAVGANPLNLSFFKLNQDWAVDSTDVITDANITPLAVPDFTVPNTIPTGDSTITTMFVNIPTSVIENWETTDVTGFNPVIKASVGQWMEMLSNEGLNGPLLHFKYHEPGDTVTYSYTSHPSKDSYRITGTQTNLSNNVWGLKNLLPQRMFFRFGLPANIFTYQDSTLSDSDNILSDTDRKRMTINKAELVLYLKNNSSYYKDKKCVFYSYHVLSDTLVSPVVLTDADLEGIGNTSEYTITDSSFVKIDITDIVMAYTSEERANNGIVIKTKSEMQNFGKLDFWSYVDAPAGKKPYIKITYSAPYFDR